MASKKKKTWRDRTSGKKARHREKKESFVKGGLRLGVEWEHAAYMQDNGSSNDVPRKRVCTLNGKGAGKTTTRSPGSVLPLARRTVRDMSTVDGMSCMSCKD